MVGGETNNASLQNSGIVGVLKFIGGSAAEFEDGVEYGTAVALEKILADPIFHDDKPDINHPIAFTIGKVAGVTSTAAISAWFLSFAGVYNRCKYYNSLAIVPESLETALNDVDDLKKDLDAIRVIEQEKSHDEPEPGKCGLAYAFGHPDHVIYSPPETKKVIDKPAVTEPDQEKRKLAKEKLNEVYNNSEFYSARYTAGVALGKDAVELTKTIVECKQVLPHKIVNQSAWLDYKFEEIVQAAHDAAELYRNLKSEKDDMDRTIVRGLLKECYNFSEVKDARIIAAKALGYSSLRIMTSL